MSDSPDTVSMEIPAELASSLKQALKAQAAAVESGEPCAPCGDAKEVETVAINKPVDKPPYWVMLSEVLQRSECTSIIELAKQIGFDQGTIVTGEKVRNSTVAWLRDPAYLQRIRDIATAVAPILRLDCSPELLQSLQIGHYKAESEDYKWHVDHDPTRRNLQHDRKLSLVAALTDGGCLEISDVGVIKLNAGDMLAFPGIVSHQAPPMPHERYTLVAWIPGPPWR